MQFFIKFLVLIFFLSPAFGEEDLCKKEKTLGNSFLEKAQQAQKRLKDMNRINVCRNKKLYRNYQKFLKENKAKQLKILNDIYLPHTDFGVSPSELFKQKTLLVIKTSNFCLGEDRSGTARINFYPCSERTGELLWHTVDRYVDGKEVLAKSQNNSKRVLELKNKSPNLKYVQIKHNGRCLTFPQALQGHDDRSQAKFDRDSKKIVENSTVAKVRVNIIKMENCTSAAIGQLWKISKVSDADGEREDGFQIKERSSGFCVRTESDAAHLNLFERELHAVIFPCTGSPNEIFELRENIKGDVPVWYDHSGVIKTENEYCLDVPATRISAQPKGTTVFLKKCEDDRYDRWDFVVEYDKKAKIINDLTGFCLYPYQSSEGIIPGARTDQLVQRPCADLNHHDWYIRLIEDQDYFQLEATDRKTDKPSGKCMIAEEFSPNDENDRVEVFIKKCEPETRGRWKFGHWSGKVEWVEWDPQNVDLREFRNCADRDVIGINDLTCNYWVDHLKNKKVEENDKKGVCRVITGDYGSGKKHEVFPGTWNGKKKTCSFVDGIGGDLLSYNPLDPKQFADLEVMTGLMDKCTTWRDSKNGLPESQDFDKNGLHPKLKYTSFLVGGSYSKPHFYLCRKKIRGGNWLYGFQTDNRVCSVGEKPMPALTGQQQVLTINNDCGN